MRRIGRFFLWIIGSVLLIYTLLFLFAQVWPPAQVAEPALASERPLVIAHQGGDGLRPSNTMSAFNHAVELGADVLEMDIHTTSDGVIVVIHDATVDRTTNGTGRVQDLTFAEIQELDAGYNWPTLAEESHREDRPYRDQGITIPALEEVLAAFPDKPMVIEIKQKEPSMVEPFCDLLKQYNRTGPDQIVVPSFHQEVIEEFRAECPGVPTAVVQNEVIEFYVMHQLRLHSLWVPPAEAFQVPRESAGLTVVTPRFVENLQAHGVAVHPWTINDESEMVRILGMGVDGIITDYPDKLLEILEKSQE